MTPSRMAGAAVCLVLLAGSGQVGGKPPQSTGWEKADESALRRLISSSHIQLGLYMDGNGFPHQRLVVPAKFVMLYRKDPDECLTVLLDIVRSGKPHDANVAFQFGEAGDQPQIAIPLFAFTPDKEVDRPYGKGVETKRELFTRLLESTKVQQMSDQESREAD